MLAISSTLLKSAAWKRCPESPALACGLLVACTNSDRSAPSTRLLAGDTSYAQQALGFCSTPGDAGTSDSSQIFKSTGNRSWKDLKYMSMSFEDLRGLVTRTLQHKTHRGETEFLWLANKAQTSEELHEVFELLKRNRFQRISSLQGQWTQYKCSVGMRLLEAVKRIGDPAAALRVVEDMHELGLKPRRHMFMKAFHLGANGGPDVVSRMCLWHRVYFGTPLRREVYAMASLLMKQNNYVHAKEVMDSALAEGLQFNNALRQKHQEVLQKVQEQGEA